MEHEAVIRLGFFFGVFAVMATLEALFPRKKRVAPRGLRWSNNLAVVFLGSALLVMAGLTVLTVATLAARRRRGEAARGSD